MRSAILLVVATACAFAGQIPHSQVIDIRSQLLSDGQLIHSVQKVVLQPKELILLIQSANSDAYLGFIDRATQAFRSVKIDFRPGAWLETREDKILLFKRAKNPDGSLADEVVAVDRVGNIAQTLAVPHLMQAAINLHTATAFFPDGDRIEINGEDGSAVVFDGASGEVLGRWKIPDPVVAASKNSKVLLLDGIATTAGGEVLLNMNSPLKVEEGARILSVRRNGEFVSEVRLALPAIRDFASGNNPDGHMLPMKMSACERTVVLADMRGVIATYQIPR